VVKVRHKKSPLTCIATTKSNKGGCKKFKNAVLTVLSSVVISIIVLLALAHFATEFLIPTLPTVTVTATIVSTPAYIPKPTNTVPTPEPTTVSPTPEPTTTPLLKVECDPNPVPPDAEGRWIWRLVVTTYEKDVFITSIFWDRYYGNHFLSQKSIPCDLRDGLLPANGEWSATVGFPVQDVEYGIFYVEGRTTEGQEVKAYTQVKFIK
jgi:hypothetical protein